MSDTKSFLAKSGDYVLHLIYESPKDLLNSVAQYYSYLKVLRNLDEGIGVARIPESNEVFKYYLKNVAKEDTAKARKLAAAWYSAADIQTQTEALILSLVVGDDTVLPEEVQPEEEFKSLPGLPKPLLIQRDYTDEVEKRIKIIADLLEDDEEISKEVTAFIQLASDDMEKEKNGKTFRRKKSA